MDIHQRAKEALQQGHLMSLGTVDDVGVWVADIIYIFDDNLTIYWMSSPRTRHSKAIELNGKAAGTITISTASKEDNFALQFDGVAKKIDSLDFDIAQNHLIKRGYTTVDASLPILKPGTSWYMLKPTSMYLIDEKHFGFDRQNIYLRP